MLRNDLRTMITCHGVTIVLRELEGVLREMEIEAKDGRQFRTFLALSKVRKKVSEAGKARINL